MRPKTEQKVGADAYRLWPKRVENAVRWRRKHWNGDLAWDKAYALARGDHWPSKSNTDAVDSETPSDRIKVNLAGSTAQDFEAYLMRTEPRFLGEAELNEDDQLSAVLQGELLTKAWHEHRMQKQAKRAVRDMIQIGTGILRTGWQMTLDTSVKPDKDGEVNYNDYVREESPWMRRVAPKRFVWDPDSPEYDLDTARWAAEIFLMPKPDVLASRKYNEDEQGKKIINKLKSGTLEATDYSGWRAAVAGSQDDLTDEHEEDPASTLYVIYDVWDKKFGMHWQFLAGVDEGPIFEEPWPYPYLDGFPFIMGSFIELNDQHFGKGLMMEVEDQQHELNRIRTSQFQHRRRMGRRLYTATQAIEPSELLKLKGGKDGDVVRVPNQGALAVLQDAPLPADTFRVEDIIKEDIRELTGQSAMMAGHSLPSRTSAAEIKERQTYAGMKLEDRVNAVDDFILRAAMQILQHMKANMKKSKVVRIAGPLGNEWEELTADDIKAEVDIKLVSTTTPKGLPEMERQQATNLFQIILSNYPTLVQAGVYLDLATMFQWLFRKYGVEKEVSTFFSKEPPPGAEALMMGGGQGGQQAPQGLPSGVPPGDQAISAAGVSPSSADLGAAIGSLSGGAQF